MLTTVELVGVMVTMKVGVTRMEEQGEMDMPEVAGRWWRGRR